MNDEIRRILYDEGISEVGFAKLKYFKELESILKKQNKLNYGTPFQVGDIDTKVFKNSEFKSAIVCLMPYQKNDIVLNEEECYVSSSAWGIDYHIVLKGILNKVSDYLLKIGYKAEVCVDNNPYDERYLAREAGLGFYGVNNLLINERYGSYFFIGVVLTDATFNYNTRLDKECYKCMKCVNACPGGAISEEGILNGRKCLSYITQKKELTHSDEELINQCIYGCDICSRICPHNENIESNNNFKLTGNEIFDINKYKKLSNKEFKDKYGMNAFSWRGKKVIERNIEIYKQKVENKKYL